LIAFVNKVATADNMMKLLKCLQRNQVEAYVCAAKGLDRRNQSIATVSDATEIISIEAGKNAVKDHVQFSGHHRILSSWQFGTAMTNQPYIFSRLFRPASVPMLTKKEGPQFTIPVYGVSRSPYPNMIIPLSPTSIAVTGVSFCEPEVLESELQRILTEFTQDTGKVARLVVCGFTDDMAWFSATTTSMEASEYICKHATAYGSGYDYVYNIHGRNRKTQDQFEEQQRRSSEQRRKKDTQAGKETSDSTLKLIENMTKRQDAMEVKHNDERQEDKRESRMLQREAFLFARISTMRYPSSVTVSISSRTPSCLRIASWHLLRLFNSTYLRSTSIFVA